MDVNAQEGLLSLDSNVMPTSTNRKNVNRFEMQ